MSFSKARIQRFNEFENDVPAPGSYHPKFDSKVKGLALEKAERFHDNRSVCSADCNSSVSSRSTGTAPVLFKTRCPREKALRRLSKSCSKIHTCKQYSNHDMMYNPEHQLAELEVECSNKERTIQELEEHSEELKEEIRKLESQLQELYLKQAEIDMQHKNDIEKMAKLQQEVLNDHDKKHQAEMEMLRCQLSEVSGEKEREIEARKTMEVELRDRIAESSKRATALESDLADRKKINEDKIQVLEGEIKDLAIKLEKLDEDHRLKTCLLEKEKLQLNLQINKLTQERDELQNKLERMQSVILELQSHLSTLQCELDELKAEYEKLNEDTSKARNRLVEKHEEEMDKLKTSFDKEKEMLLNDRQLEISRRLNIESTVRKVHENNFVLKEMLQSIQGLNKDRNNRLNEVHLELEESNEKHNLLLKKTEQELDDARKLGEEEKLNLKQLMEDARVNYLKEIDDLTVARDREIAELEDASVKKIEEETRPMKEHTDKMLENAEAITRETVAACRAESEERVKRIIVESDAKLNSMLEETRTAVEEEMRLTAERYKVCLARVEVERAALDKKLEQRDAEINQLSATLNELRSSAETQESFGESLHIELHRAETELAEKKEELRALKDQIRGEAAEMVARRKRFAVIMAENQASVIALTKRLAQSNAEVERLQHELKRGEECIHEHRDLLTIMHSNSQMVHEQVHVLMEQLDAKKGLVDQLEANSLTELDSIKAVFQAKIEDLKQIAAKDITRLRTGCDEKTAQNKELKRQLHEMVDRLKEAQNMLDQLDKRNTEESSELSQVKLLNSKLEEQLKANNELIEDNKKLLESQLVQHKIAMEQGNSTIAELTDKVKHLEEKERVMMSKSELFEEERNKWESLKETIMKELEEEKRLREKVEVEVNQLLISNERLTKHHQEISEKYAELVGHQNNRQRIKHVSQLKDKLLQMEQELRAKSKIIEQKQKMIYKLKGEENREQKDKENIFGISKVPT